MLEMGRRRAPLFGGPGHNVFGSPTHSPPLSQTSAVVLAQTRLLSRQMGAEAPSHSTPLAPPVVVVVVVVAAAAAATTATTIILVVTVVERHPLILSDRVPQLQTQQQQYRPLLIHSAVRPRALRLSRLSQRWHRRQEGLMLLAPLPLLRKPQPLLRLL